MKATKLLAAVLFFGTLLGIHAPANAGGFQWGVKGGVTVNDFKFNADMFDASNRCGYTFGLTSKFTVPVVNLGFDASLMFTRRSVRVAEEIPGVDANGNVTGSNVIDRYNVNSNYIEIPINLRYEIGLPVVGKFVTPFLTTGPDFSFLLSKENAENALTKKKFDFAWNFGFGLLFVQKLQIHASYGLGINNAASSGESLYGVKLGDMKNRFWTVSAAYYF